MIKLMRVDERLIHLQLAEYWCTYYQIDEVMVFIKKELTYFEKILMSHALNESVKIKWIHTDYEKALVNVKKNSTSTMLLCQDMSILFELLEIHLVEKCFIGNQKEQSQEVLKVFQGIYLTRNSIEKLHRIYQKSGINIQFKQFPDREYLGIEEVFKQIRQVEGLK